MIDYARLEANLVEALGLSQRPVAVAFRDEPPAGVPRLAGSQPSGCSFWRLAAEDRVFHTVPSDHYNCPVGSYTHGIPLPEGREHELGSVLSLMSEIGYIRLLEVPAIPRLPATPAVIVYAPLGRTPVEPDAVIVAGRPARLMLLYEAAIRARKDTLPLVGRPTCMAIPAAMSGAMASSLGCVGNRIYTGVSDDEFYVVIGGEDLSFVVDELGTIGRANAALADYHRGRMATLSSGA